MQTTKSRKRRKAPKRKVRANKKGIADTVAILDSLHPPTAKGEAVIELLKEWLQDESGYDEEAWPELKKALDAERRRVGARRLFDG